MRAREISPDVKSYDEVFETFRWQVPETFNIAADVCDRHAANPALAERKALLYEDKAGHTATFTFRALKELSDKLAGVLAAGGLQRGGRAAVLMPQRPETALAHLAIYKLGAIAVPLTVLARRCRVSQSPSSTPSSSSRRASDHSSICRRVSGSGGCSTRSRRCSRRVER